MSSAVGSETSASRCIRMPTWRCSRTACWAAAIDFVRPTVIGSTTPGNSTVLRTGTMISASGGSGGSDDEPLVALVSPADNISNSATGISHFLQGNHQTAIDHRAANRAVAPARKRHATLEPPLRQFQPMDDCGRKFTRQRARPANDELTAFDEGFGPIGIDARQGDEDEHLPLGLEDVDRRLPMRRARGRPTGPEEFAMHALGPREHLAGFRPHPVAWQVHVRGTP